MTFSSREWEQKDDVNHLTTIWMKPSLYDIERKEN